MNPHLSRIRIFPVKALDGQDVAEAVVLRNAGLAHDRELCLIGENGEVLNGKRLGERILHIRSELDFAFGNLKLSADGETVTYRVHRDQGEIEAWFEKRLGQRTRLSFDPERGFPDDRSAAGPTLISTETLRQVVSWFPALDIDEVRRRFRANLEVDGVPAFWEDRLYGLLDETVRFRIGDVAIEGVKPCARCTVPSRNSITGKVDHPSFTWIFAERRRETLPAWAEASRFDHFYRLAVNTRIPETEAGKILQLGDQVVLS